MTTKCTGHHHGPKFNNMPFVCCQRCKHFSKDGKPAPDLLKEWVCGVCPKWECKNGGAA